jgi:hypothetical protein
MKKLANKFLVLIAIAIFISCDKNENSTENNVNNITYKAKWLVEENGDFKSFEFNESGSYIVVKNAPAESGESEIVRFGTYETTDNKVLNLSNFGTLKIKNTTANRMSFSIATIDNPETEINLNALRQAEIPNSTNSDLLCRTWELVTTNGEPVVGTDMELTVLFSNAGTYFVTYLNPTDENDGGLAQWVWTDSNEDSLCYSWDGTVPTCNEGNTVEITSLSENTLTIVENSDIIYVLQPLTSGKSANTQSIKTNSKLHLKKGFFKK